MTKNDFYKIIADKANVTVKNVTEVMDAFDEAMMEEIFAKEDSVRLAIGTFSGYTKETAERKGRNPKTGETITIPAKKMTGYPKFKPSKAAKE